MQLLLICANVLFICLTFILGTQCQITIKHVLQILHHLIEKKLSLDVKNKESSLWKHKCY